MLGGKGYFRGSSVLVSGTAGTGKSSIAALFAQAASKRGERCLYFAFEESQNQILRNMRSIGLNLEPWTKKGLLKFHTTRPTSSGLEMHLAVMHKEVRTFKPQVVIVDPITNLVSAGFAADAKLMLTRLLDYLKMEQITTLFTNLTSVASASLEHTDLGLSSLMDTWLLLRDVESHGERNRGLYILKSRGMAHSNQIREFVISDKGINLLDVYLQPGGFLMGTARQQKEALEEAESLKLQWEIGCRQREHDLKSKTLKGQIAALEAELSADEREFKRFQQEQRQGQEIAGKETLTMARMRKAD
jgi:circadian clock protein KaiC